MIYYSTTKNKLVVNAKRKVVTGNAPIAGEWRAKAIREGDVLARDIRSAVRALVGRGHRGTWGDAKGSDDYLIPLTFTEWAQVNYPFTVKLSSGYDVRAAA